VPELAIRGPDVPQEPHASIVILVQDRMHLLLRCLDSLARLEPVPRPEVVVVANGTEASLLRSLRNRDELVLVPSAVNLGFAAGCNWGARFARGRYLVLLNDDTEVKPGWLRSLVSVAESDARIGAVGSRLLNLDGSLQEAGSLLWRDAGTYQIVDRYPAEAARGMAVRDVDYCSACGLLVKREAWDVVGGFDEAYFPAYHEDVDLSLSLRAHGYRTVYAPDARVVHHRGSSTADEIAAFAAARNGRYLLAKWAPVLSDYELPPLPGKVESAVTAGLRRSESRALPTISATGHKAAAQPAPAEADALRVQARALWAAQTLREEYDAWVAGGRRWPGSHGSMRDRLRRLVWRLPGGRGATRWVRHRLTRG
jgi:GT2 family glycosyltransferase